MHAQDVPWGALLEKHPFHDILVENINNNGFISALYKYMAKASHKPLLLDNMWKKDIYCPPDID